MAKAAAPARAPKIRVLVHPFYDLYHEEKFFPEARGYHGYYLEDEADVAAKVWRREIDRAAEKGEHFVFVANLLENNDLKAIKAGKKAAEGPDRHEKELLAYAHRQLGDRLIFVPSTDVGSNNLNLFRQKHLRELLKRNGAKPAEVHATVFGEWTDRCVEDQIGLLAASGVSRGKIAVLPHKSVPKRGMLTPWDWEEMREYVGRQRERGLRGKDLRDSLKEKHLALIKAARGYTIANLEKRRRAA